MAESTVQLRWAYSNKRQSAYATETPSGDMTQSHPFTGADMGEHTPNMSDNAAQFGKGHEFATRNEILSWNTAFRRTFQATSKILGWAFAFHCGGVSTSSLGSGAYKHEFEYMDPILGSGYYGSARQQPAVTIYELVAANLLRIFPSMQVKSIEITGQQNDWLMCAVEMQGSGKMRRLTTPSSFTFPDSTVALTGGEGGLLRNAALYFEHGPSGSMTDQSCDVRSFRFRSEYAYFEDDGYCPGSGYMTSGDAHSGQIRNKLEFARRAVVFEFVLKAPNTSNLVFSRLEAATSLQARLTVTGDLIGGANYHQFLLDIPELNYRAVPIGADGDQIVYSVSTVVFYDNTEANPWKATVQNEFASYLTSS